MSPALRVVYLIVIVNPSKLPAGTNSEVDGFGDVGVANWIGDMSVHLCIRKLEA